MNVDGTEYGFLAWQLQQERAAAKPVVRLVGRLPTGYVGEELSPEWMTIGFVDELCDAARELLEQSPAKSVALAAFATHRCGH